MTRVSDLLPRPYPQILNRWLIILVISIFISLFLIINMVILPVLLPGLLGEDAWTIGKHLLFLRWIVVRWAGIWGFIVFLVFTLLHFFPLFAMLNVTAIQLSNGKTGYQ